MRPFWVPAGIRRRTLPLSVVDRDLAAEERLGEGDRQVALEVGARPGEHRVRPDPDRDDEVAAVRALAGQLDLRARCRRRAGS